MRYPYTLKSDVRLEFLQDTPTDVEMPDLRLNVAGITALANVVTLDASDLSHCDSRRQGYHLPLEHNRAFNHQVAIHIEILNPLSSSFFQNIPDVAARIGNSERARD